MWMHIWGCTYVDDVNMVVGYACAIYTVDVHLHLSWVHRSGTMWLAFGTAKQGNFVASSMASWLGKRPVLTPTLIDGIVASAMMC